MVIIYSGKPELYKFVYHLSFIVFVESVLLVAYKLISPNKISILKMAIIFTKDLSYI